MMRTIERDMSLDSADLLLPPKSETESQNDLKEEDNPEFNKYCDEEKRERLRKERKCNCQTVANCRHFLTYDLFEVCLALREVHGKRKNLHPIERRSLQFTSSYHDWFMPPFAAWLAVVSEQVSKNYSKKNSEYKLAKSKVIDEN